MLPGVGSQYDSENGHDPAYGNILFNFRGESLNRSGSVFCWRIMSKHSNQHDTSSHDRDDEVDAAMAPWLIFETAVPILQLSAPILKKMALSTLYNCTILY